MTTHRITSRKNPLVQSCVKLSRDRTARRACGLLLGDSFLLLEEVPHALLTTVIFAAGVTLPSLPDTVERVEVPDDLLAYLSPSASPEGVVFLAKIPPLLTGEPPVRGRHLYLEGLQDPGNVGSILRSARAFGCDSVLLDVKAADPFSPKALRASMGAAFHVPIREVTATDAFFASCRLSVCATVPHDDAIRAQDMTWDDTLVLLGNEGNGLSDKLLARADRRVTVPMAPGCESLGVAACAAILLWEMSR